MGHIHVDTTSYPVLVLFVPCPHARLHHTCSHTSTSAIHQHHNDVGMVAEQCVDDARRIAATLLRSVFAAETGQESSPQWKGRMERAELRDEKLRVFVFHARSSVAGKCRRLCDEPRHSHRRWRDRGHETLPRLGDEREGTSVGSDQRNHRHERTVGMASVHLEVRSKQSAASAILNVKTCPSELTAYQIALDEWQENIRQCELISGDHFNVSMKKALFFDKAPSSVRVPLEMQNLSSGSLVLATQRTVSSRRDCNA